MKFLFIVLFGAALVTVAFADRMVDFYSCSDKPNGNYPHPVDCTRFITCSNKIAYERDCAICSTDPIRCPDGRLIFDQDTNMCLWANQANCGSCKVRGRIEN